MPSWKKVVVSGSDAVLNSLNVTFSVTASSFTGSFTGSLSGTASFAQTASYADNFTVGNTLTAQRIVVQTISSSISYLTGSTRHGSLLTDTHQFTGSVNITGSLAVSTDITGSTIRATSIFAGPSLSFSSTISSNGGEIRIGQTDVKFKNDIPILWSQTTDSNGTKDLGLRRNNTGSLEIYDGVTADGAVANRRDLLVRNITGSNALFSGSLSVTAGITGSLSGSATTAISSSFALTASYWSGSITNANSASNALTASYVNPLRQNVQLTGSLFISSSTAALSLIGSGSGVFSVDGTSGRLFSVDDSMSGSLFSVNTAAGLPIIEAFSDNTIRMGQFGQKGLFVSGSRVGIGKETPLNASLDISGSTVVSGSLLVTGSTTTIGTSIVTGSLIVTGSSVFSGSVTSTLGFTGSLSGSVTYAFTSSYADNFTVGNTLTAQRIVVQTISSSISYASGSNRFGSLLTDTQTFTGSVGITGSLVVSGSTRINDITFITRNDSSASSSLYIVNTSTTGTNQIKLGQDTDNNALGFGWYPSGASTYNSLVANTAYVGALSGAARLAFNTITATQPITFSTNDWNERLRIFGGGNIIIGGGNTPTDAGFRLDVSGSTRLNGSSITGNASSNGGRADIGLSVITDINNSAIGVTNPSGTSFHIENASNTANSYVNISLRTDNSGNAVYSNISLIKTSAFTGSLRIHQQGTQQLGLFTTGNLVLQNGGTFTDAGYRLDVNGTTRLNGALTVVSASIQSQNTSSLASGTQTISTNATSSYTAAFYNYTIASGSNTRAGQFITTWNGSSIQYMDNSTVDIGSTSTVALTASLSGANVLLTSTLPSSGWTIKTLVNLI